MRITREEVLAVVHLARLEIADAAVDVFSDQIGNILDYINLLNQVDTTGISPTSHATSLTNAFREDVEKAHMERSVALANSPENDDGAFIVPRVIG
jgi:aspartyl-tRNA(Asn)/glutamyl-tRNA(Gln) amidotransferase subunit C